MSAPKWIEAHPGVWHLWYRKPTKRRPGLMIGSLYRINARSFWWCVFPHPARGQRTTERAARRAAEAALRAYATRVLKLIGDPS